MKTLNNTGPHVLLVDDDVIVLNILASGLNDLGYKVTSCETSQEALDLYKSHTPDLIITDYRIPNMDGVTLARTMIDITHRPIIMLSAFNDLPMIREAVAAGVTSYLVKPVEADRLAPCIEAALARFSEMTALLKRGDNIQAGIESQRLISMAVGIVMVHTQRPQDLAFESLRKLARNQRRPLKEVAFDLVDTSSMLNTILQQLPSVD